MKTIYFDIIFGFGYKLWWEFSKLYNLGSRFFCYTYFEVFDCSSNPSLVELEPTQDQLKPIYT